MTPISHVRAAFVELVPTALEIGVLYISVPYSTAIHLCCCGCGATVVTPLAPAQWSVTYNGRDVSLAPSIGNWSYPCRSHYWISAGTVVWAGEWTERQIALGRQAGRRALETQRARGAAETLGSSASSFTLGTGRTSNWWQRLRDRFRSTGT